jgi:hypothetical protein
MQVTGPHNVIAIVQKTFGGQCVGACGQCVGACGQWVTAGTIVRQGVQ